MAGDDCLSCGLVVSGRQQALQCEGCERWAHRTCDGGVNQAEYRRAVRGS